MNDLPSTPTADMIVTGAAQLLTLRGPFPRIGRDMRDLGIVEDGAIAATGGKIIAAGRRDEVLASVEVSPDAAHVDAAGRVVMPGFVDAHTHLVFGTGREVEYEARVEGVSYEEIARRGGGIASSVRSVRGATYEHLLAVTRNRLRSLLIYGTTTVEAKSGYGLSTEAELKQLRVLREVQDDQPVTVVPTFLGAHAVAPEFVDRPEEYVDLIVEEMLPEVARLDLAEYCDAWPERGVFTLDQARRVLEKAKSLGLRLRVHADELSDFGAARLAAELGADSADHLVYVGRAGMEAMRDAGVVATLLPGTSWSLQLPRHAPVREMIDMGLAVAIASDFNPGSCMTNNMGMIISIACTELRLLPAEAITAATVNAAHSLRRADCIGQLSPGYDADLIILDMDDYRHLPYHFGVNHVRTVIKRGQVVFAI